MPEVGLLAVHGGEEAAAEAAGGVDRGAARGQAVAAVVTRDVFVEDPVCAVWVEERVEDDEVGGFAYAPFVLVFHQGVWGDHVLVDFDVWVVLRFFGAPDVLLGLLEFGLSEVGVGR